jgi:hypothetical protein
MRIASTHRNEGSFRAAEAAVLGGIFVAAILILGLVILREGLFLTA